MVRLFGDFSYTKNKHQRFSKILFYFMKVLFLGAIVIQQDRANMTSLSFLQFLFAIPKSKISLVLLFPQKINICIRLLKYSTNPKAGTSVIYLYAVVY